MTTITLPVLILYGTDDGLAPPSGALMLDRRIASADKTMIAYPGLFHEILNEPERDRVLTDIRGWLADRLDAGDPGRDGAAGGETSAGTPTRAQQLVAAVVVDDHAAVAQPSRGAPGPLSTAVLARASASPRSGPARWPGRRPCTQDARYAGRAGDGRGGRRRRASCACRSRSSHRPVAQREGVQIAHRRRAGDMDRALQAGPAAEADVAGAVDREGVDSRQPPARISAKIPLAMPPGSNTVPGRRVIIRRAASTLSRLSGSALAARAAARTARG